MQLGIGRTKLVGAHAKKLFSAPSFSGRVLAAVSNAAYVAGNSSPGPSPSTTGEEEILWFAQNLLPMHARALRGDFDLSALHVGMTFQSDGTCLHFDMGTQHVAPLRFADARTWQPTMLDPARVAPREVVMARARELHKATRELDLTEPALSKAKGRKPVRSLKDARALIGLGEGLTPSGDDFVGGWLFTAYHLRAAYPDAFRWEQEEVDDLLDWARARTNVISHTLLRDHARGQGVESLHDLVAALLQGNPLDEMMPHVRHLIETGNTTGQAMLAGAIARMFLMA